MREVDWNLLSDRGAWILRNVALPASMGFDRKEIAQRLGKTESFVTVALAELRGELSADWKACANFNDRED